MEQGNNSIKIHQDKYAHAILSKFGFRDARPSQIPIDPPQSTEHENGSKSDYMLPLS